MKTALTRTLILLGALLVLAAVNYSIHGKEQVIRTGEPIYLELAPVDPRSLMQGDYMALRFQLADAIESSMSSVPSGAGQRALIVLDDRASRSWRERRRQRSAYPLPTTQRSRVARNQCVLLRGRRRIPIRRCALGEFRVDRASGEAVLVALRDGEMRAL